MALDFITHLATSSIGCGVFGVIKVGLDYFASYKKQKEINAHEIELEKIRSQNKILEFQAGIKIEEQKTKQAEFQVDISKQETLQEEQRTYGVKAEAEANIAVEQEKTKQGFMQSAFNASAVAFVNTGSAIKDFFANITVITRASLLFVLIAYILYRDCWIWLQYKGKLDVETITLLLQQSPYTLVIIDAFAGLMSFFAIDRGGAKLLDRFAGISTPSQKKK